MLGPHKTRLPQRLVAFVLVWLSFASCLRPTVAQTSSSHGLVELVPIDVDPKRVERRTFGSLTLLSAFQLASKDKRFGGLSGLSVGPDGRLYAVSDNGYWLSASMLLDPAGALKDLVEWRIAPILTMTISLTRGPWATFPAEAEPSSRTRRRCTRLSSRILQATTLWS